jgi:carboxyl-terminal processing protease
MSNIEEAKEKQLPQQKHTSKIISQPTKIIAGILIILILGFGIGLTVGKEYFPKTIVLTGIKNQDQGQPEEVDFSLYWDVYNKIQEKYFDRNELDYQQIIYSSISGLVQALDDPYSEFFPPKETEQFIQDVKGAFEGIGAEIEVKDGILTVVAPLEGMPAEKAGLEPLDRVVAIEGESTKNITIQEAVDKIRGPRGSIVTLTIQRGPQNDEFNIKIKRDVIKIPIIRLNFLEDNIAHLRIVHFSESSAEQFAKSVTEILNSGSDKLILDLRNNPGGFLEDAISIASYFLPEGEIITTEDFGGGQNKTFYRSRGFNKLGHMKIVILVNQGSASASEILAGALRDLKNAKLVGVKTFGKGSVQEFIELKDGTSIKITVAKWLTPSNQEINDKGLEPDFMVEHEPQPGEETPKDTQLQKAIEIVKGL